MSLVETALLFHSVFDLHILPAASPGRELVPLERPWALNWVCWDEDPAIQLQKPGGKEETIINDMKSSAATNTTFTTTNNKTTTTTLDSAWTTWTPKPSHPAATKATAKSPAVLTWNKCSSMFSVPSQICLNLPYDPSQPFPPLIQLRKNAASAETDVTKWTCIKPHEVHQRESLPLTQFWPRSLVLQHLWESVSAAWTLCCE